MSVYSSADASSAFHDALPTRNSAVRRINNSIKRLDMDNVEQVLKRTDTSGGVYVCDVSFADWDRYILSERQLFKSRFMEWRGGKLYIIELPSTLHDKLSRTITCDIIDATGTRHRHLACCGSSYVQHLQHIEPDESFGPSEDVPGVQVPPGLPPYEFHTLKVEIGVSRDWSYLDPKATSWSHFPGVQYILCIYVSPAMEKREYKLHEVQGGAIVEPRMPKTPITAPTTLVSFKSHRLLSLPPTAPLPVGFASPNVTIDLNVVVAIALRGLI